MHIIITIDGPAASGKSSSARLLAQRIHAFYLATGFLYRAVGYCAVTYYKYTAQTIATITATDVRDIIARLAYIFETDCSISITFDSSNITSFLKHPDIDLLASIVGRLHDVRLVVSEYQKKLVEKYPASIVEGRDAGTIVFPHATYKFFLTADPEVRARRWCADQNKRGNTFSFEYCKETLAQRDARDLEREEAPLRIARGSIIVDTTHCTIEQTVDIVLSHIHLYGLT